MKLYEVPRNTWITIEGERFFFEKIDGMYSICINENQEIVHIAAFSDVEIEKK